MVKKASTTAVATPKIQLPANVIERMEADKLALIAQLAAPSGNNIGVTQSKQFKFPDGKKVPSFKGVIVDFVSYNAFYAGAYNADVIVPPNCFALGAAKHDDLFASKNSPDKQHPEGEPACKGCKNNLYGSAINGKGKACKNSFKLAILCADGEVRTLGISATGIKEFGAYVRAVVSAYSVAPYAVMTEFSFDKDSEWSSVRCGNCLKLDDDQLAQVLMMRDDAHEMLLTEPDVSKFEPVNVPKGRPGAGPKTKARA